MTNELPALVAAVFGLFLGSFANVVAVRDAKRASIVTGRSACPACGHVLAWYDLVPLLSFFSLAGRCRYCRAPISRRYPAVELAAALVLGLVWYSVPQPLAATGLSAAFLILLVVGLIDLQSFEVPLEYVLAAGLAGAGGQALAGRLTVAGAGYGLLAGAGILLFVSVGWKLAFRQDGMGDGDIWIAGVIGLMLGVPLILVALMAAVLAGAAFGLAAMAAGTKDLASRIPFGPFLALGGLIALVWGQRIADWYILGL